MHDCLPNQGMFDTPREVDCHSAGILRCLSKNDELAEM